VSGKEVLDAGQGCHERAGKLRKGRRADDHQQGDAMSDDGIPLVRLVTDVSIMGQSDPAALPDFLQPHLIGRVRRKVISMRLDRQTA
jgi:hypothetical protein